MTPSSRCAALIVLLSMLGTAERIMAASRQDCHLKQYASLDVLIQDGGVLVPVTLDGHQGYMHLSLASAHSAFYQGAVDAIGLPHRRIGRSDIYWRGKPLTETATFHSIVLGNANLASGEFILLPESTVGTTFGFLGMAFFDHVDFELDLRHKKVNLFSQDHCPGNVVYWSESFAAAQLKHGALGNIFFEMELEGKKVNASFSPASSTTTLTTEVTRNLFGFDENSPGVEHDDAGAGKPRAHYRAMRLRAPGLTATNTKITLVPGPAGMCGKDVPTGSRLVSDNQCSTTAPLSLGRNVLEALHLYFATRERVLYFTAAGERD